MKIINILIKDIKEDEMNTKIHTPEQIEAIAKSIQEFGMNDPIAIWGSENLIVEGHGRLLALKSLNIDKVKCVRLDHLSEKQRKAYAIAHNSTNMLTGFDDDILSNILEDIDIDMSIYGIDIKEEEKEVEEDNYSEDPKTLNNRVRYGEVWELGNHRLMCGDGTNEDDVNKLMNNKKADMILIDPPYNVDYEGSNGDKIRNDNLEREVFVDFLTKLLYQSFNNTKPGGSFYIWYAAKTHIEFETAINNNNQVVRQQLIWNKNHITLGRQDYQWKHEPCLYGWVSGGPHYFVDDRTISTVIDDEELTPLSTLNKKQLIEIIKDYREDKISSTVINEDKPLVSDLHPTMKPIKLLSKFIKNSSIENDIVVDLCGGSGSTLIACEQLDRICYMMEYDPVYANVIIDRWEKHTGQKANKIKRK